MSTGSDHVMSASTSSESLSADGSIGSGDGNYAATGHEGHAWLNSEWTGNSWTRPEDDLAAQDLDYETIRRYAAAVLRRTGTRRIVPTPLDDIRHHLDLETVVELDAMVQDVPPRILARLRRSLRKVRGFLAVRERVVYIDSDLRHTQSRFVLGHELGHHVLPWQREAFNYQVDTDETLTPVVRQRWEREANAFSAELLFNVDELNLRSVGAPLSLTTPIELQQQFDSSLIATTRRFVEDHDAAAALLLLGRHPVRSLGQPGTRILYGVQSRKFRRDFGPVIPGLRLSPAWPRTHHDLALDSYLAVTGQRQGLTRGRYASHEGMDFNYEVFTVRPYPFILLTPRRRVSRVAKTRVVYR